MANIKGYIVIYNDYLKQWQVWNDYTGYVGYFDTEDEAREYCKTA